MSALSLSYYESDATIANISQSVSHIVAGKQLAWISYEEITSLTPYVQCYVIGRIKSVESLIFDVALVPI